MFLMMKINWYVRFKKYRRVENIFIQRLRRGRKVMFLLLFLGINDYILLLEGMFLCASM